MQETKETWVRSLGQEDPLEEEMATHSSIRARRIPWTEKIFPATLITKKCHSQQPFLASKHEWGLPKLQSSKCYQPLWWLLRSFVVWSLSCGRLCDPMDCSTPGFPFPQHLLEFAQTYVHGVSDAIQPSHLLLSPSLPDFSLSQHQGLFQWVSSSHQVAKVLELQYQSFQWVFRVDFL